MRFFIHPHNTSDKFRSSAWNKLSTEEKLESLQALENSMALKQGRKSRQLLFDNNLDDNCAGFYSRTMRDYIFINSKLFDNPYECMNTVIHEGRHAFQDDICRGIISAPEISSETKDLWTQCFLPEVYFNGNGGEDGDKLNYFFQATENDAHIYAENTMKDFSDMYGDDSVYQSHIEENENRRNSLTKTAEQIYGPDYINEINAKTNARCKENYIKDEKGDYKEKPKELFEDKELFVANQNNATQDNNKSKNRFFFNDDEIKDNSNKNVIEDRTEEKHVAKQNSDESQNLNIGNQIGINQNNELSEKDYEVRLREKRVKQDNLSNYMNEHNYGEKDYDTYSKDPEWQKLNNEFRIENGKEPIKYDSEEDKYLKSVHDDLSNGRGVPESPELDAIMQNEKKGYEEIHGKNGNQDKENKNDSVNSLNSYPAGNTEDKNRTDKVDKFDDLNTEPNDIKSDQNTDDKYEKLDSANNKPSLENSFEKNQKLNDSENTKGDSTNKLNARESVNEITI